MMKHLAIALFSCFLFSLLASAQTQFDEPTRVFLMHSSGNHLEMGADGGGWIRSPQQHDPQQMTFIPDGQGYYNIQADGAARFLALQNSWNTSFIEDATSDNAKYAIESAGNHFVKLRCKANNKYLGTDANTADQKVYTDKSGSDLKHYWYFSDDVKATPPADTLRYMVSPQVLRQHFDGWGVSLCWWAAQCGKWTDQKIDEIVSWMVSPTGLNYSHFRYNIGGGDDPQNRNCTQHHMGNGKGLRAEMEGFKDFSGDEYHWDRDAAQRKIMLKIKEKRPDAVFEAFSNSCPYYMTYSGCVSGNSDGGKDNLKPEYYEEFAHYLVDVCQHYKDEYGIEFKTLEPFNEANTNYWHAGGGQEGCHFDVQSQIKFLRVLAPILKASGLNTIISAADETSVGGAVDEIKRYMEAGVDNLVGQWNTHTYSGSNVDRVRFCQLARQTGKPHWMSEVGAGGSGIGGNLSLAQKLIDDMRYIQPEAWIDWQYVEENNDQWCTVRGSFSQQTYQRVKNYYVRQQCSRFIKHGYDIVTSLCPQSLAAVNAARDTLVLVLLNEGSNVTHEVDLSLFTEQPVKSQIRAYRTSGSENLAVVSNLFKLNGNLLTVNMTAQSIVTLVIPIRAVQQELLIDNGEYLMIPRHETMRAISATGSQVTIEDITYAPAQRWKLERQTDGSFVLVNALGLKLTGHRASGSTSLTAVKEGTSREQKFFIELVDTPYYKILSAYQRTYAFDLVREGTSAGTAVDLWEYAASTTTPTHRQWMLFPLKTAAEVDGMGALPRDDQRLPTGPDGIYDAAGRCIYQGPHIQERIRQLPTGLYVVRRNHQSIVYGK